MTHQRDAVRRHDAQHIAHFFDSDESRADVVAAFVQDGLEAGDTILVVATLQHWGLVAARLRQQGVEPAGATDRGPLTVWDAAATLNRFMRHGLPDPALFHEVVGTPVGRLVPHDGGHLRIYGEMVDILAASGDFMAAERLEQYWNELARRHPFTLLCGYSTVAFGDPRSAAAMRSLCGCHSGLCSDGEDSLASFLLSAYAAQPSPPHLIG